MEKIRPTESELEILQVLWEHGPVSVRFVNECLNEKRPVGYTTTLKIMQIMLEKGLVSRDERTRTHIYRAEVQESSVQKALLARFVDATFRGSATRLVMQALGTGQASKEELEAIKALIRSMEEKEEE